MRVENLDFAKYDGLFEDAAINRIVKAAKVVRDNARRLCPTGTNSRPIYKTGKYAGQPWTSRDAGRLKKSIRIVRRKNEVGRAMFRRKDVRVYAGHYMAWYAAIVEFNTHFMKRALAQSEAGIRAALRGE